MSLRTGSPGSAFQISIDGDYPLANLAGKIALVTGASRGLGRATAARMAQNGARVLVHYAANKDGADSVVDQIRAQGGEADAIGADLAAPDGPHRLAAAVRNLGLDRLDVLVANAGTLEPGTIEDQTVEAFDRQFAINVRAPFFLVQQLLPMMGDGGSIVLFSSIVTRVVFDDIPAYSATKGAIEALTRDLAKALGPRGIRVNAVSPGVIDTDMAQGLLGTDEGRSRIKATQALSRRIGKPDDIADVVLFLASDQARWVDGRSIEASGGALL